MQTEAAGADPGIGGNLLQHSPGPGLDGSGVWLNALVQVNEHKRVVLGQDEADAFDAVAMALMIISHSFLKGCPALRSAHRCHLPDVHIHRDFGGLAVSHLLLPADSLGPLLMLPKYHLHTQLA